MAFGRLAALAKDGMIELVQVRDFCRGGGSIPTRVHALEVADGLWLTLGWTMWYLGTYLDLDWMDYSVGLLLCFFGFRICPIV